MSQLQTIIDKAIATCLQKFSARNLKDDEIAVCLVDMREPQSPIWAGYRQDEAIFPASLVKLFFAVAAYNWLEQGRINKTSEFDRAMQDMLVDSSNDATSYIVDLLTDTVSGPELPEKQMQLWAGKRNAVNEFFAAAGYQGLNLNQKTWSDGPFGRERTFVGEAFQNRNRVTAQAVARLLVDIVLHRAAAGSYCDELLGYLRRDKSQAAHNSDSQKRDFIGGMLPDEASFWSKAGWTSSVRHDAIYVDYNGVQVCLVVFTVNHSQQPEILQSIGWEILNPVLTSKGTYISG